MGVAAATKDNIATTRAASRLMENLVIASAP
jgi:hypothetical protein